MSDPADEAQEIEERQRRDALARVLGKPVAQARRTCADCGADIPLARRQAVPGVKTCVGCQERRERDR